MTDLEFLKKIGSFRSQKQKLINDTFLWVSLSIVSLETSSKSEDFLKLKSFEVPSKKLKIKMITRKPEELRKILIAAKDKELYQSTFIYIIAQFEAYFSDMISAYLSHDQRKLRINIAGGQSNKKVDISELLDCTDYDSMIKLVIDKQLGDLFYAGPKKQREYIENVLSITLEDHQWLDWFEYRATRDLFVHNSGKINSIYLEKVDKSARGKLNEMIIMDKNYFEKSLSDIKSMIGHIDSGIRKKFKLR
jgi:hypothetical protein